MTATGHPITGNGVIVALCEYYPTLKFYLITFLKIKLDNICNNRIIPFIKGRIEN